MERTMIGLLALGLASAPTVAGATAVTLEFGVSYQQQQNSPCVIGDPSCHNPAGLGFTVIPPNMSAGTLTSPVYTVGQIRELVGDRFAVGIDLNQAQQTYILQSFELNIDGGAPEFSFNGPAGIPAVNKGNGYSDAQLIWFDISGLSPTSVAVFTATFANGDGGREEFFLVPGNAVAATAPEPSSLVLLATSALGVGGTLWRRWRREPNARAMTHAE